MVADNSTLYPTTRLQQLIQDSYYKCSSLHEWPSLVRAKTTTTTTDEYYDYPDEFRDESIVRLIINGKRYSKKNYEDFMDYKIDQASYLNPFTAGYVVDVYGCIQPEAFVTNNDLTIFSLSDDSGNEAVVKKALSVALAKSDPNTSILEENGANTLLDTMWNKIKKRQQREERLNHPFFVVPDFFGRQSPFITTQPTYIYTDYQRKIFIASFR